MSWGIETMGELSRRGVKTFAVLSFWAFTSCAIAGRGAFHLFTPPSRYAARTMQPTIRAERSHLSCGTGPRAPLNDVSQRGHLVANVPRMARRSPKPLGWVRFPTAPARGRVATGQCETAVVMAHMEMTMLAENCTVGGKRLIVMVLHL